MAEAPKDIEAELRNALARAVIEANCRAPEGPRRLGPEHFPILLNDNGETSESPAVPVAQEQPQGAA